MWNPDSWALKLEIQRKESGISLMVGSQVLLTRDPDAINWKRIRNPQLGIMNRPSLIILNGAKHWMLFPLFMYFVLEFNNHLKNGCMQLA